MGSSYGYRVTIGPGITPMVKYLVVVNVLVYLWQSLAGLAGSYGITQILGLTPYLVVTKLFFWQLVTYLFLHGGFLHIFFNMFALWMFGSELERNWGGRAFLRYYFVTGIGAGVFSVLFDPFSPIPTIGASGAIYGILMAYGIMFPDRYVYLYFLFPIKVKYFVGVLGALTFFSTLGAQGSTIAHIAHLGGMVVGFLYLKGWLSAARLKHAYYRWKLQRARKRFTVHRPDQPRRNRSDDDFWIN